MTRAIGAATVVAAGAVVALYAFSTTTAAAGWSAAVAAAGGCALVLQVARREVPASRRLGDWILVPLPALLVLYLSFNAGGYFPGTQAFVCVLLTVCLALRVGLMTAPFAGCGVWTATAAAALAAWAVWDLVSGTWSHAWGRAFLEFDQTLVYALVVLTFGGIARDSMKLRWMVRTLAIAGVAVCTIALVTRLYPDVWPIGPNLGTERLSYPLTYWNALGILAAITILLTLYLASSRREPWPVGLLASAALPVLATTLYFTFSRGAIAAAAIGVVILALLGRPHRLLGGFVATLLPTAVALKTAYGADLLSSATPTTRAAVAQGHDIGPVVLLCAVGAAALWLLTAPLDDRLTRLRTARPLSRGTAWAVSLGAAGFILIAALAAGAPSAVSRQYDRFVGETGVAPSTDLRQRLTDPSSNHRVDEWRAGIHAFDDASLHGTGAGTYENIWARARPDTSTVVDAHSLYVESLAELGIVGFFLCLVAVGSLLAGVAIRVRGPSRALYAAVLAVGVAWAFHAGIDWDWENPAVTIPFFSLGAVAVARAPSEVPRPGPRAPVRAALALGMLAVAVIPVLVGISEHRLQQARDAAASGDCRVARVRAAASLDVLGVRAEPHQLIAFCEGGRAAVAAMNAAAADDPGNWEYRYDAALLTAADGGDPRPELRRAAELNPLEPRVRAAVLQLSVAHPRRWRITAKRLLAAGV